MVPISGAKSILETVKQLGTQIRTGYGDVE